MRRLAACSPKRDRVRIIPEPTFSFGKKERESAIYAPSTRRFRVALGRVMVVPSKSFVTLTWHPSRDLQKAFCACGSVSLPQANRRPSTGCSRGTHVSVKPNARSSMSCFVCFAHPSRLVLSISSRPFSDDRHVRSRHRRVPRACRTRPPPESHGKSSRQPTSHKRLFPARPVISFSPLIHRAVQEHQHAPSMSKSYSHETSTMSSPSLASTVTISPSGFLKCSVILHARR